MTPVVDPTVGLLLAAGAGRRLGQPKSTVRTPDGDSWLDRSLTGLREAGCDRLTVVLGAGVTRARALLAETGWSDDEGLRVVVAEDWEEGMGASLRAGLRSLGAADVVDGAPLEPVAALVTLVDLPDVGGRVVARVLTAAREGPTPLASTLLRATYDGTPGHPVLLGRDHWAGVVEAAQGDRGARDYLAARDVAVVECGDLATGHDVDRPDQL